MGQTVMIRREGCSMVDGSGYSVCRIVDSKGNPFSCPYSIIQNYMGNSPNDEAILLVNS